MRDDAMRRLLEQAEAADTTQLVLSQGTRVLATMGDGGRPISTMWVIKLVVRLIIGRAYGWDCWTWIARSGPGSRNGGKGRRRRSRYAT